MYNNISKCYIPFNNNQQVQGQRNVNTSNETSPVKGQSSKKQIIVSAHVIHDGLGDYFAALTAAKTIKKNLKDCEVRVIIVAEPEHKKKGLPLPFKTNKSTEKKFDVEIYYERAEGCARVLTDEQQNKIEETIKNCDLHIGIAAGIPKIEPDLFFKEYTSAPGKMGLGKSVGVFIKKYELNSKRTFNKLEDSFLQKNLFNTEKLPTEKEITLYKSTHDFHFGYLKAYESVELLSLWGGKYENGYAPALGFIYSMIAAQKENSKVLDICVPTKFIDVSEEKELKDLLSKDFLRDNGISTITIIKKNGSHEEIKIDNSAPNGKQLRLIDCFPLSHKDMQVCMNEGQLLVGATGDGSFSDAISNDKMPFYEIMEYKKYFYEGLLETAGEIFPPEAVMMEYLNSLRQVSLNEKDHMPGDHEAVQKIAIKIAGLLKNEEFKIQTKQLIDHIKENHSFSDYLIERISNELNL